MLDPLTELATVPPTPIHPAVIAARARLAGAIGELLTVADGRLDDEWQWRPDEVGDTERRYGFYRIHERLETATAAVTFGRSEHPGELVGPALAPLGAAAAARWELHGVLVALSLMDWDADPGGGEWTIRQTMGHIIGSQRSYGWYNAWFLAHPVAVGEAVRPSDHEMPPEPTEEEEASGSPSEVAARLDEVVDAAISANAALDPAAMRLGARWSGLSVSIDFRLGRYGSHLREHTVQIDKTLAMLDRQPTEVARLVRLILATYGRLEAGLAGRSATELDRPILDGASAAAILDAALKDVVATAERVRADAN